MPSQPLLYRSVYDFHFTVPSLSPVKSERVFWPRVISQLALGLQGSPRKCSLKLVRKVFASVRPVLTCVDKALHELTSDFQVLILK